MILTPEEADLYYKLHWALLAHAARRLDIFPPTHTVKDILALHTTERKMELREAVYADPNALESFIAENPEAFPPDELSIVASWRHRVSGDFYIVRYWKRYTIFLHAAEPERLYAVLGLRDPIEKIFAGRPLPIYVRAVLLPFKDKIVYDGLLTTYNVFFGGGIQSSVKETYNRIKRQEGFIEQLTGPDGEPQVRTSLDRRTSRKPPSDWKPAANEIVTQDEM